VSPPAMFSISTPLHLSSPSPPSSFFLFLILLRFSFHALVWLGYPPKDGAAPEQLPGVCSPRVHHLLTVFYNYTVKKVSDFPGPSGNVTNQTLPGRELG
jgi:hypothetical protein